MLAKCGIIPAEDGEKIVAGLKDILADIEAGKFHFDVALEDIHMNVEARLTERIGSAGARLHTARSRNDQVALDMHMYMKKEIVEIAELLINFEKALLTVAKKHEKNFNAWLYSSATCATDYFCASYAGVFQYAAA